MKFLIFLFKFVSLIIFAKCIKIKEFSLDNHPNENLAIIKCGIDLGRYELSNIYTVNIWLYFNDTRFYKIVYNDIYFKKFILAETGNFSVDSDKSNKTHTIIKDIENLTYGQFKCKVTAYMKTFDGNRLYYIEEKMDSVSDEKTISSVIGPFSDTIKIEHMTNEDVDYYKDYIYESSGDDNPIKIEELLTEVKEKKSKSELKIKYPYFLPYYTRLNLDKVFDRVNKLDKDFDRVNKLDNIVKKLEEENSKNSDFRTKIASILENSMKIIKQEV